MNRQRVFDIAFVAIATLAGAWLRLRQLGVPCFWLDEIIHYDGATGAMKQSLWQWLAISQIENGPLYYATQLAGRLFLPMEASARIVPALCGIATIPLVWIAARSTNVARGAAIAATLLIAISPLHVDYSREGRPYAMIALIATALLIVILRRGSILAVALLLLAAFYTTALIAPYVIALAVAAFFTRQWRIAGASAACLALMALCYHPGSVATGQKQFPAVSVVLESFATHWTGWIFAALAIVGAIALLRSNVQQAIVLITLAVVPVLIPMIAAWRLRPYFSVRYTLPALPAYLLLVAFGVSALVSRWRLEIVAALLLTVPAWKPALNEPFYKLDWRTIARAIATHSQPGDRIIAAHHWSAYCLGFYLRDVAPQIPIIDAKGFPQNEPTTPTWIVVSQDPNGTFTPWACRFPILLGSPIENFHLHFAGAPRKLPRIDEDSGGYVDEISVWRGRGGHDLPPNVDRARLAGIVTKLGFNPDRAIPALTSHRVTLANLVSTVADNSICDDDATFLRRLYEVTGVRETMPPGVSRSDTAWKVGDSLLR
jgi:hypothetical protein